MLFLDDERLKNIMKNIYNLPFFKSKKLGVESSFTEFKLLFKKD